MSDIGGPNHVVEDEPKDIYIVCEILVRAAEPKQLVPVEERDEVEGSDPEMEEDPEEDFGPGAEENPESENERCSEELVLEGVPISEQSLMGQMADVITELEDQVEMLQEENNVLHNMKDQFETVVHHLVTRNANLVGERNGLLHQYVELSNGKRRVEEENEAMKAEFDLEIADKMRIEKSWEKSCRLVDRLEHEVRGKKARMDMMSYAFTTAFDRLKNRVISFPAEEGQTRFTMSREKLVQICNEEFGDVIRRGVLE